MPLSVLVAGLLPLLPCASDEGEINGSRHCVRTCLRAVLTILARRWKEYLHLVVAGYFPLIECDSSERVLLQRRATWTTSENISQKRIPAGSGVVYLMALHRLATSGKSTLNELLDLSGIAMLIMESLARPSCRGKSQLCGLFYYLPKKSKTSVVWSSECHSILLRAVQ